MRPFLLSKEGNEHGDERALGLGIGIDLGFENCV